MTADSWDSSRRRRASPQSRYSGSDSTSSATNRVSRSPAATKAIIPARENSTSGNTSVWVEVALACSLVSTVPTGGACTSATNAPPGSTDRSATSSTEPAPSISRVPHRNRVGWSTDRAPDKVDRSTRAVDVA